MDGVALPEDPFERRLALITVHAGTRPIAARLDAADLSETAPHRPEAWLALLFLEAATGEPSEDTARRAYGSLSLLDSLPVEVDRLRAALRDPVAGLGFIPPLLVGLAPYAAMTPGGPVLGSSRRAARRGDLGTAIGLLEGAANGAVLPPAWHEELLRLKARKRG